MKRNIFAELVEGFEALEADRDGRITLRQHHFEAKPAPDLNMAATYPDTVERLAHL